MTVKLSPQPRSAPQRAPFLVVKCHDCSSEQVVFSRPSTTVNCAICGSLLVTPTGGMGNFRSEVLREAA